MFFVPFVLLFALLQLLLFYNFYWKRRHLPPGPTPWPLLGNLLEIGSRPPGYDIFLKWRDQFGPIYTYWLGERPMVAFADFELINETIVKDGDTYTDRDFFQDFYFLVRGQNGLVHMEGKPWREHRRFLMAVFRNLGVGKNAIEQKVLSEFSAMCVNIDRAIAECHPATDMELMSNLDLCIGSIINSLLFGYQFHGQRTKEFFELKRLINEYMFTVGQPSSQFLMSWWPHLIRHLPYFSSIFNGIQRKIMRTYAFFERQIAEHQQKRMAKKENSAKNGEESLTEGAGEDYVSAFLEEIEKRRGTDNYDIKTLYAHLLDFWIAGQETTTDTLNWGIIHLIHSPRVQQKLHEELDSVIGSDRMITLADKVSLSYSNAVINEIMRIANLLPQNFARRNVHDVKVRGHLLPKGTSIVPQISCVLYDEKVFPEPRLFKPERFLEGDGTLRRVDELIPFSVGKRYCAGESLARMELFLVFVNLFNQYKITAPNHSPMPSKRQNFGLTVAPIPYKCQIEKRRK
ncbi:hypothetical protein niasHT_035422 [Heterodera trifolii]|uniref:Cytochrome P450 n=1 Tax=Heterodera trifolii TaxID=157864 RepID=A0ABD2I1L1_9BILA